MNTRNTQKIFFLSASDRINYGDLLFPIIFKQFAQNSGYDVDFRNYGIIASNLSHFGALPTQSYQKLIKDVALQDGKLVLGGGDILLADWSTLSSFIYPWFARLMSFRRTRYILQRFRLAARFLGTVHVGIPFCPSKAELNAPDLQIFYSSVGGTLPTNLNDFRVISACANLIEAQLVSVRDERSLLSLKASGIHADLVPDSALLMSDMFPIRALETKVSFDVPLPEKCIYLQLGRFKGPKDLPNFSKELRQLGDALGLSVVLCPIGLAPGHEDDKILKQIALLEPSFLYIHPRSVFDVMYLIARSNLYLGTSLHGIITAQSFGVPFCGLNPKLLKVDSYIRSWMDPQIPCIAFSELLSVEHFYRIWNHDSMLLKLQNQKIEVRKNLHRILEA